MRREGGRVQQSWGSAWQVDGYTDVGSEDWVLAEHRRQNPLLGTLIHRQGQNKKNLSVSMEGGIGRRKEGVTSGIRFPEPRWGNVMSRRVGQCNKMSDSIFSLFDC